MLSIKYPHFPFKMKEENGKHSILDEVRKKWVRLSPEEWVRQNFIQYLLQVKKYPASLIAVEKEITVGELKKRCDIVVYRNGQPWMIVECKEQNVELGEAVIQQVLRYNIRLKVAYLVISNGQYSYAFGAGEKGFESIAELPAWEG